MNGVTVLTLLVVASVGLFWLSALIVVRAIRREPHPPRALVQERLEKILLAIAVTIWAVVFWNADAGNPLFGPDVARVAVRLTPLLLLAKPLTFIVRYALNGFRDDEYREAGRRLSR